MAHHFDPSGYYAPRKAPTALIRGGQALAVIGILCFVAGLFMGRGVEIRATFLVNLIYFTGLCFGGFMFSVAMTLTLARWGRPLKRICESFIVFTPILWVLTLVFFLTGGLELYEWYTHPGELHAHKAKWLTPTFFVVRQLIALGVMSALGLLYYRHSLRQDLGVASAKLNGDHPKWWSSLTSGWKGDEAEIEANMKSQLNLGPPLGIAYAIVMTFYSFDMSMSLAPHWYSNMFGGWFFASSFWIGMAWTGLLSLRFRGWLGLGDLLTPTVYHDLGKLCFAFCMVWAYMTYAQILPIWYGNMTEEIGFLLVRMTLEPWTWLSRIVGAMCFLIPFATLLSRGIKKMPLGFSIILTVIVTGVWLERFLVAVPSIWKEPTIPFGILELGLTAGFFGAFVAVIAKVIGSVPPVPVTDPYMQPHPDDVHVTPSHAH